MPPSATSGTDRPYPQIDHPREPPEIVYSGGDRPSHPQFWALVRMEASFPGLYPQFGPVLRISNSFFEVYPQNGVFLRMDKAVLPSWALTASHYGSRRLAPGGVC